MRNPLFLGLLLLACASGKGTDPRYAPTESILEVVSVLRMHVDDDTYRFPPARDFTGKNVYRVILSRTEALEELHAERLRSGYMVDVLLFTKARALERLSEYEAAAQHYSRVMDLEESPLRESAGASRRVCLRLEQATRIEPAADSSLDQALAAFDRRLSMLEALAEKTKDNHYAAVVKEEIERADRARAHYFSARARIEPWLDVVALQQYQHLVQRHTESKNRNRHLLDLADHYSNLSRQYVERFPPVSLGFDPATFDEFAFGATRLYESVSQQDGAIEKIEAARKLEAYLAFTLQVYDEKLPR